MKRSVWVTVLLSFLTFTAINFSFCNGDSKILCHERERKALLLFKQGLKDPKNRISSWVGEEDCCKWKAVECNNVTGHVIKLHLQNPYSNDSMLTGELNPSLLELEHLMYLDLSWNNFKRIPEFFGSLRSLRYLKLKNCSFVGVIPHQLGNLTNLFHLDLSWNAHLRVDRPWWLSRLSSLKYLDMSNVKFESTGNWLQVANMLPSLSELRLAHCQLDSFPPSLQYVNFTSLSVLDLGGNGVKYMIPSWFFNLSLSYLSLPYNYLQGPIPDEMGTLNSLKYLDLAFNIESAVRMPNTLWNLCNLEVLELSNNNFRGGSIGSSSNASKCIGESLKKLSLSKTKLTGQIPEWFGHLIHLKYLILSYNSLYGSIPASLGNLSLTILSLQGNQLSGSIPASLGNLSSLRILSLQQNQLNGSLPVSLGQLSNLVALNIFSNALDGVISEAHFTKLANLKLLDMTSNSFTLRINPNWVPPFQLIILRTRPSKIASGFPTWLHNQYSLYHMDLSSAGISDMVPNWFWDVASHIRFFDLSNNQLQGDLSNVLLNSTSIDLSSNCFKGRLPHLSSVVTVLFLAKNSISGSLSTLLCEKIHENSYLLFLDLSENLLWGKIPNCWTRWKRLKFVNLGSNHLFGTIPSTLGSLYALESLRLRNNSLSGNLPSVLKQCQNLQIIDLGENMLSGNLPSWIGELLKNLKIIRLRSNKFSGNIPQQLCSLPSLQVLDLAYNSLTDTVPRCLNYLDAMVSEANPDRPISFEFPYIYYVERLLLVTKGREFEYSSVLRLVKSIDLSSNNLSGEIPHELTNLFGLCFLNLSGNFLTGKIPEKIDKMKLLESFDLSRNHLSGTIPKSISTLTFLNFLNLSYNNFSGRIPLSTQLQSFSELSYTGNPELCGVPLSNTCIGDGESQVPPSDKDDGEGKGKGEDGMLRWFYIGAIPGFFTGFWGICGVFIFKKSWRYACFQFLDNIKDQVCVVVALKLAWLQKKIKREQVGEL